MNKINSSKNLRDIEIMPILKTNSISQSGCPNYISIRADTNNKSMLIIINIQNQ